MSEAAARGEQRLAEGNTFFWPLILTGLASLGYALAVHWPSLPYTTDELQYLLWSKDLEWGYFSKPPGIAVALRLWALVDPLAEYLRLFAQLCYGFSLLLSFRLLRDDGLSPALASFGALALGTMPLIGFAQWFFTTDALLLMCWLLGLLFVWRASTATSFRLAATWWVLLGFVIAIGTLCKHSMLFFWIGLVVQWALPLARGPRHLLGLVFCFLGFVLVLSPHVLWLIEHPGTTLKHLLDLQSQGFDDPRAKVQGHEALSMVRKLLDGAEFIGAQWLGLGIGIILLIRVKTSLTRLQLLLLAHSVPVLGLFILQATISQAYANWALPATFTLGIALVSHFLNSQVQGRQSVAGRFDASVLLSFWVLSNLLISLAIAFAAPGLKMMRPELGVLIDRIDPFHRQRGWDAFDHALMRLKKPAAVPWGVSDRDSAARVLHRFGDTQLVYRRVPGSKPNHYALHYPFKDSGSTSSSQKNAAACTWFLARESQLGEENRRRAIARIERPRLSGRAEVWLVWPEACD